MKVTCINVALDDFKIHDFINYVSWRIGEIQYYMVNMSDNNVYVHMQREYDYASLMYLLKYFFTMEKIEITKIELTR